MNRDNNIFNFGGNSENNSGSGGGSNGGQSPQNMGDFNALDRLIPTILLPKPFGSLWPMNLMMGFLIARGYRIITRTDDSTGNEYRVAVKKGDECIPSAGNVHVVFVEEVQRVLLKWLIRIGDENDRAE